MSLIEVLSDSMCLATNGEWRFVMPCGHKKGLVLAEMLPMANQIEAICHCVLFPATSSRDIRSLLVDYVVALIRQVSR